jgi:aminotransferase in exopolysaccharide biosynthesis
MTDMLDRFAALVRRFYSEPKGPIPLHAPVFAGKEKEYLCRCVDTTFVSSVGEYVTRFEDMLREFSGAAAAVAVVNGTCGLTAALGLVGVRPGEVVLTQALTFVATANAVRHAGAEPVFLDSDPDTLGMSPDALRAFLDAKAESGPDGPRLRADGRRIAACLPMHVLGHACRIREIAALCQEWRIPLVEDAAEALGSTLDGRHLGLFGRIGVLSFNGNKTVTTGGGGMLLTNDPELGARAKRLTATAKRPHPWEFFHDETAWNYRMPNVNAALGCAQMERIEDILADKRDVAAAYREFFANEADMEFVDQPEGCRSNFWLCSVRAGSRAARDAMLEWTNAHGIATRPLWRLMTDLPMYAGNAGDDLDAAREAVERVVSLPSGPRWGKRP